MISKIFFLYKKNNKITISFTYFISKGCDIGEPIPRKTELAGNHSWIGQISQISHRFAFYLYRNNVLSCTKWELYTRAIGRLFRTVNEQRHDKTNKMSMPPAKTQISLSINPGWSESSLSTWRKLGSLATHWVHSEDSDQPGRMPRLIWVFTVGAPILLVLSCVGSNWDLLLIFGCRSDFVFSLRVHLSPVYVTKVQ